MAWGEGGSRCFANGAVDLAGRIFVLPDGGLLEVGVADSTDLSIAKLTPTGDFDTTFAATGKKRIARSGLQQPTQIAQDGQGRIVIGALCHDVGATCIFRLDKGGELDATFKGGVVFPKVDGADANLRAMLVGPSDETGAPFPRSISSTECS